MGIEQTKFLFLALAVGPAISIAQECPKIQISQTNGQWQSVVAPDSCSADSIFTCTKGHRHVLVRVREGANDLFQGTCKVEAYSSGTLSPMDLAIQEANRRGITLEQLDAENRAKYQRQEQQPSPMQRTPASERLTASNPIQTEVAAKGESASLSLSVALREKAKASGVPDVILNRAFTLYSEQLSAGKTSRGCFAAADMTTPATGKMWILCDRPSASVLEFPFYYGHGEGQACRDDFMKNDGGCAKYFSNLPNSCLPVGGRFITEEASTAVNSKRNFIALKGLNDFNSNVRARRIGIHRAVMGDGATPYAKDIGVEASQGCFVIPPKLGEISDLDFSSGNAGGGLAFYAYPEPRDIKSIVEGDSSTYWDSTCKDKISKPAWMGKGGDSFADEKTMWADELPYIENYYQEEVSTTD